VIGNPVAGDTVGAGPDRADTGSPITKLATTSAPIPQRTPATRRATRLYRPARRRT
jgi:hypothetical protein